LPGKIENTHVKPVGCRLKRKYAHLIDQLAMHTICQCYNMYGSLVFTLDQKNKNNKNHKYHSIHELEKHKAAK
jgi:hypothetical protein